MYDLRPNLVIGFHGCDEEVCNKLLNNPNNFQISRKPYDWLGNGLYFWENNLERAYMWAKDKQDKGRFKKAAVIGAVINLGHCLDLLDSKHIHSLAIYHQLMTDSYKASNKRLPENRNKRGTAGSDRILRLLDCAVIEYLHTYNFNKQRKRIEETGSSDLKLFDSARGVFVEGEPIYEGAGFNHKSHIQICVRNPNSILGFFLPRKELDFQTYVERELILN